MTIKDLQPLVGKIIESIEDGNDILQNDFIMKFKDGTVFEVTAIGDDMTYIEFKITEEKYGKEQAKT